MDADALRVQKLGVDDTGNTYWYFYGTRLYKEEGNKETNWDEEWKDQKKKTFKKKRGRGRPRKIRRSDGENDDFEDLDGKNNVGYMNVNKQSRWSEVCDTIEEWVNFAEKFKDSQSKNEKALFQIVQENFLPTLNKIYEEKENKLQQKLKELMPVREKIVTRRETRKQRGVHFEESQFECNRVDQKKLSKSTAVPTLFSIPNPPKLIANRRVEGIGLPKLKSPAHFEESQFESQCVDERNNLQTAIPTLTDVPNLSPLLSDKRIKGIGNPKPDSALANREHGKEVFEFPMDNGFDDEARRLHMVKDRACRLEERNNDMKLRRSGIAQETLNRDIRNIFLKQRNCDVTFKVKDQELQAHRLILEARSPVFAAMFEHSMTENRSGVFVISDAEPEVFRDLLLYAYSGDQQIISSANVFELYALSEKFNFNALKQECAKFIEFNVSAETVCDALVLAHKYCDAKLNQSAEAFFRKNRSAVLESEKLKKLEKKDYLFAIGILKSIVLDGV